MYQSIFTFILGLSPKWRVSHARHADGDRSIEIDVVSSPGADFSCPVCSAQSPVVCEEESIWHHDNFFNLRARISVLIPQVCCETCGINRVLAPWEQPGSQFRPVPGRVEPGLPDTTPAVNNDMEGRQE